MTTPEEAMAARLVARQINGRAARSASDDETAHRFEIRGTRWVIALEVTRVCIDIDDLNENAPVPVADPAPLEPTTRIRPFRLRAAGRRGPTPASAVQQAITAAVERAALDGAGALARAREVKGRHLFVWICGARGESAAELFSSNPPFDGPELAGGVNVAWVAPWEGGAVPSVLWCASPDWELPKDAILGDGPEEWGNPPSSPEAQPD